MVLAVAMLFSSCSVRGQDEKPPSAPVLTVKEVLADRVSLAWSESYDDIGIDEYRLFRNGAYWLTWTIPSTMIPMLFLENMNTVVAYDKAGTNLQRVYGRL